MANTEWTYWNLAANTRKLICQKIKIVRWLLKIMDSNQDIAKANQFSVIIRYVVLDYELRSLTVESLMSFFAIDQHGVKNYK